jgi:hypothetical protein
MTEFRGMSVGPYQRGWAALCCLAVAIGPPARAHDPPAKAQPVAGRWSVREGDGKTVYLFRDGGPDGDGQVDLFSYHMRDSNKDGIDEVRLSRDRDHLVIESQGYPNHPTAIFPNSGNPNAIRVQEFTFRLPLVPQRAEKITRLPMGPIGVAINGVVFFNPFEQGGMNAVDGYSEVWLDSCCGHPQQTGVYHYHKYPTCVKSPFPDDGKQHSPVIGFAFDGFPIHGPYEAEGLMAMDIGAALGGPLDAQPLDSCNGHSDPVRGYHYHVTPGRFPYIIGGYAGVPEPSNNRDLRRPREGAIVDNTEGTSRQGAGIADVRPGSVARGARREVRIMLDAADGRGRSVPADMPAWVQIGPYEAVAIGRQGNVVIATLDIPTDATLGVLLDCHLEFGDGAGPGRRVLKKNDVLRVTE